MRFVGGAAITIYDSEKHYESYQVYIGDRLIRLSPRRRGSIRGQRAVLSMCGSPGDGYAGITGLPMADKGGNPSGRSSVTHQYSSADNRPSSTKRIRPPS